MFTDESISNEIEILLKVSERLHLKLRELTCLFQIYGSRPRLLAVSSLAPSNTFSNCIICFCFGNWHCLPISLSQNTQIKQSKRFTFYTFSHQGRTIILRDGRSLGFAEHGVEKSEKVLFAFHGIPNEYKSDRKGLPGSRLFRPNEEVSKEIGVRVITVDR